MQSNPFFFFLSFGCATHFSVTNRRTITFASAFAMSLRSRWLSNLLEGGRVRNAIDWVVLGREKVGEDPALNKYYIRKRDGRLKREVDLKDGMHGDMDTIPSEWSAWLRKARDNPPSTEEVERGIAWRQELRRRGQAVELRDKKRKLQRDMSNPPTDGVTGQIDDDPAT